MAEQNNEQGIEWAENYRREERERQRQRRARVTPAQRLAANMERARRRREDNPAVFERHLHSKQFLNCAGFSYDSNIDYSSLRLISIGACDSICAYCSALRFVSEPDGLCCLNGKVRVQLIEQPPEPILTLFSGDYQQSRAFLDNIRSYNSVFQMTSFGCQNIIRPPDGFRTTFKIQGQIYHRIGALLPEPNVQPQYLQVYFTGDNNQQIDLRTARLSLDRAVVENLQELFDSNNLLLQQFKSAHERLETDNHRIVIRADRAPAGEHPGRYNDQAAPEVAIIYVDGQHSKRDIVIQRRSANNRLERVYEMHPNYDALQYPLIFWRGNCTYDWNMKQYNPTTRSFTSKSLSTCSYYAYQLMIRSDEHNFILKCNQLLNQFAVDMFAKVEAERLRFIRQNQSALRATEYVHLRDALANDRDPHDLGQRVVLPSTFTGSPRHMNEYHQDAMAYVRLYGRADLFITFTCNPKWPEIRSLLLTHQKEVDRHDAVARVFELKVKKLMHVITKCHFFGETRCYMYTIEWQKRGLPHTHILLWLKDPIWPEDIDNLISAELPCPQSDPVLHGIVKTSLVHGPCGVLNPLSPCMENGKCTKKYPRRLHNTTITGEDGYPLYRRRSAEDGGFVGQVEQRHYRGQIDNQWIVPHNKALTRMFNAHINVEYCNSVRSIKYICKYINKGGDMAAFQVENSNDEVTLYQTGRYISSNEAFWRLFSFPIHARYPAVVQLAVHLENGQRVYFNPDRELPPAPPRTTLTEFFKLCADGDQLALSLLYIEMPTFYTWNKSTKVWSKRRRGRAAEGSDECSAETIGRLYTVHPSHSECFFLRILLTKTRGPRSFEDLKTVDGVVCATYREACLKRGLLESDSHWRDALRDAASTRMPSQMRDLFTIILHSCEPSDPLSLWNEFRCDLSEDLLMRLRRQNQQDDLDYNDDIFNQCLILIEDLLLSLGGKVLTEYNLPAPNRAAMDLFSLEVQRELNYDLNQLINTVDVGVPSLLPEQRSAYDALITAIDEGRGGIFFIDAPGGTGKTYLLNLILAKVRLDRRIILATASSGIAATLLQGGRTAHSTFKIPLDVHTQNNPSCSIQRGSAKGRLMQECKAIVWDECTMVHRKAFEAVDATMKDLRQNDSDFGGVVVILAGDFRQTLPVIPRSLPADQLHACLKQSHLWPKVQTFRLSTNMRVHLRGEAEAQAFSQQLLEIGNGTLPSNALTSMVRLPNSFCVLVSDRDSLISRVYPDLDSNYRNLDWLQERAILAPTNEMVNVLNDTIQDTLTQRESRNYYSVDTTTTEEDALTYPVEFLNSLTPSGFPPHELSLKVGSPVILIRNLKAPKLVNGVRLRVKHLYPNVISATIMTGSFKGEDVLLCRIPLIHSDQIEFKRLQFPIRLSYAMTINKSQGQSLKVAGVELSSPCFSHGQLYVACSRVGTPNNLYIHAADGETKNIVYQQALR